MMTIPYLDAYWVIPGRFLAGNYPGDYDKEGTRKKVQSLIHTGINCVIDLTQPGDAFSSYDSILKEEAADYEVDVERFNFPIPDYDIPTVQTMKQILDLIDDRLAGEKNIYVHCVGGIGRTGTVVACHLVRHGLAGQQALVELQVLRQGTASWYRRSPESDMQIDFVLEWEKTRYQ
jgi:predicted protein tyrosine phosphatase